MQTGKFQCCFNRSEEEKTWHILLNVKRFWVLRQTDHFVNVSYVSFWPFHRMISMKASLERKYTQIKGEPTVGNVPSFMIQNWFIIGECLMAELVTPFIFSEKVERHILYSIHYLSLVRCSNLTWNALHCGFNVECCCNGGFVIQVIKQGEAWELSFWKWNENTKPYKT